MGCPDARDPSVPVRALSWSLVRRLAVAGLGVLWLAGCAVDGSAPRSPVVLDHLPVASGFRSYHVPSAVGLMSSIVDIGGGQYLVGDTANVYRVVRSSTGYALTRLARPSVRTWNPVGLAYRDGVLYVADGAGRDVLELGIAGDTLTLMRRITNDAMQDAENVAAQPDGSVVVTDQAAGAVLMFQPDGALLWSLKLTGAHGLTSSGGRLYVSSLADGTIREIDRRGRQVRSAGRLGVSSGRYVWPVGLATDDGRILVTDAHTGHITVLSNDLQFLGRAGGDGPGLDVFNFPFATLPVTGGYLVVDTFKVRLVRTDRSWTVREQVALGPLVPVGREKPLVAGSDAHPHTYATLPGVDVVAALGLRPPVTFVGALNGLDHLGRDGQLTHLDVIDPQFGSTSMTWAQAAGQYIVVGSSQRRALEVVDPATGMFTFVDVGPDSWWRSGALMLASNLRRALDDVIAPAVAAFARARQLLAQGAARKDAFNQALAAGRPRNWVQDLSGSGSSAAAQEFLRSPMGPDDARRYFDASLSQPTLRVVELLEVKYLSSS
jgi:hypothetical protein